MGLRIIILILFITSCNELTEKKAEQSPLFSYALNSDKVIDETIISVEWRQISGPNQAVIETPNQKQTNVSGLTLGKYYFEFSVTNNLGLTGRDTMTVDVLAPPLLVNVENFKGVAFEFFNEITWTADASQGVLFELQDTEYKTIYSSRSYFNFRDRNFKPVSYYRLKQTDAAGLVKYSETIKVVNNPQRDRLIIVNPVHETLYINFISTERKPVVISISSFNGALVMQKELIAEIGSNRIQENVSGFAAGTYIVLTQTPDMKITSKFVKL